MWMMRLSALWRMRSHECDVKSSQLARPGMSLYHPPHMTHLLALCLTMLHTPKASQITNQGGIYEVDSESHSGRDVARCVAARSGARRYVGRKQGGKGYRQGDR